MELILGVIFGLLAMLGWGISDFFAKKIIVRLGVFRALFWNQLIGFIPLLALLFFVPLTFSFSLKLILIFIVMSLAGAFSYLAFYKGLEKASVSIISPVAASYAVITIILSLIFFREIPSVFQVIGIILAILGTIFISTDLVKIKIEKNVIYALLAMLGWGFLFFFMSFLVKELSWFLPFFIYRVLLIVFIAPYGLATKQPFTPPKIDLLWILALMGFLDALAFLAYNAGTLFNLVSVVTPIGAAFPAVTVLLARIFYKEKLVLNQKIGLAALLVALVVLAL